MIIVPFELKVNIDILIVAPDSGKDVEDGINARD